MSGIRYVASPPPAELSVLSVWVELQRVQKAIDSLQKVNLPTLNAAPVKPLDGDLVKADGTNWNPGGGSGVYVYDAGSWVKL